LSDEKLLSNNARTKKIYAKQAYDGNFIGASYGISNNLASYLSDKNSFIFSGGMRHSAVSKLNSDHSALRNSPGRTKTSGASCNAHFVTKWPL
jgi:hypothetical protein